MKKALAITTVAVAGTCGVVAYSITHPAQPKAKQVLMRRPIGVSEESAWEVVPAEEIPPQHQGWVARAKQLPFAVKVTLFAGLTGAFLLFNAFVIPFLMPARKALGKVPFLPTDTQSFRAALAALPPHSGAQPRRFLDLGSGDGRNVCEAALEGMQGVGIEMNPWLRRMSYKRARKMGVEDRVEFRGGNYWEEPLAPYDVVGIYGLNENDVMERVKDKMQKEARPDAFLLSTVYEVPGWKAEPYEAAGLTPVHIYRNQ